MRRLPHQRATARKTSAWAQRGARLGFAARGLTYLLLSWLSVEIAVGRSHRQASDSGAFALLAGHAWGVAVLAVMAIGFAGYAAWSLITALRGPGPLRHRSGPAVQRSAPAVQEEVEPHAKDSAKRATWLIRAALYGFLCYLAVGLATGAGHGTSGDPAPLAARVMREPAGRILVAAAGAAVIIAGLCLFWRAARRRFMDDLRTDEMTAETRHAVGVLGVAGSAARGFVVVLVGTFLLVSGLTRRPGQAKGLDASLVTLAHQPYGAVALIGGGASERSS